MSVSGSDKLPQLIFGNALKNIVQGSAGLESEKDLNGWFQTHLQLSYSAVWRKLNPASGSWEERDLLKVATGLGLSLEDLLFGLSRAGQRLVDANVEVMGSNAYRRVVLGEQITAVPDHGIVAFASDGRWSVVNAAHAGNLAQQTLFEVKSVDMTPLAGRKYMVAHIDDDSVITQTAKELLSLENIHSTPFTDDDGFLTACATQKFDAVLVDWGLVSTTAERLIREFREFKGCATTPIVLVTGAAISDDDAVLDDLKRVSREYDCRVLTKPVRWRLVAADLQQQIEEDKSRSPLI